MIGKVIGFIFKRKLLNELSNDLGLQFLEIIPGANEYKEIFWGYTNKTLYDISEYENFRLYATSI